ncbi:hypothetical protein [Streptomyces sp. NPDC050164]
MRDRRAHPGRFDCAVGITFGDEQARGVQLRLDAFSRPLLRRAEAKRVW